MAIGYGINVSGYDRICLEAMRRGERCFYCGKQLSVPVICWSGHSDIIFFHVACALRFVIRLIRDVHEVDWTLSIEAAEFGRERLRNQGNEKARRILSSLFEPSAVEEELRNA